MFDAMKFKKKYPFILEFVNDSATINMLAKSKNFDNFYEKSQKNMRDIVKMLSRLYSKEIVSGLMKEMITSQDSYKVENYHHRLVENLNNIIFILDYINEDISVFAGLDPKIVINNPMYKDDICKYLFNKYYLESVIINNRDLKDIFYDSSLSTKINILVELKRNKINDYKIVIEELSKTSDVNIERIFEKEIPDGLCSEELKSSFDFNRKTRDYYAKFLDYYLRNSTDGDKQVINHLLEAGNYELIRDICHIGNRGSFPTRETFNNFGRRYLNKEEDYQKDAISVCRDDSYMMSQVLYTYFAGIEILKDSYYKSIDRNQNNPSFQQISKDYKIVLDILRCCRERNWKDLTLEEQETIIEYLKSNSSESLKRTVEELNQKITKLLLDDYSKAINGANSIIEKAKNTEVEDSLGVSHQIPLYELKDEEPFTFLITVMKRDARKWSNLYGRPQHEVTIDDPSKFEEDLPNGSEIISTSMINQNWIENFLGPHPDLMYIFSDVSPEKIVGISCTDGGFAPRIKDIDELFLQDAESPEEFMWSTRNHRSFTGDGNYNEIAIERKDVRPTAILCFDKVNDDAIRHAEYFGIPIIIINTKTYYALKNFIPEEKEDKYVY